MNNSLIAILVLIVVAIVGWLAYSQGYFEGVEDEQADGFNIQVGGASEGN